MYRQLTRAELEYRLPALYTEEGYYKTSEQYQPITTAVLVDQLESEGFYPTYAVQSVVRSLDKKRFAKHLIRFRHSSDFNRSLGEAPEIVLINSHDGLSSYRLYAGLVRFACSNGLIVGNRFDEIRVRHKGDTINNVVEGTYKIVSEFSQVLQVIDAMKSIMLSQEDKLHLAEAAHNLRFDEDNQTASFEPGRLLLARRAADTGNDLFSVFNVVQENVMRGGISGFRLNNHGRWQRTRSREIKSIDQNLRLNRELWSAAEGFLSHNRWR